MKSSHLDKPTPVHKDAKVCLGSSISVDEFLNNSYQRLILTFLLIGIKSFFIFYKNFILLEYSCFILYNEILPRSCFITKRLTFPPSDFRIFSSLFQRFVGCELLALSFPLVWGCSFRTAEEIQKL